MIYLDIDIGNTRLKWRVQDGEAILGRGAVQRSSDGSEVDELVAILPTRPDGVRVVSVAAEAVEQQLLSRLALSFGVSPCVAVVTPESGGVRCGYREPSALGVDRWLAVLGASRLAGASWVVVDCGTAITVDLLSDGEHQGGYIVPGIGMMHRSLFQNTARVRGREGAPDGSNPGRNTQEAVNRGVWLMAAGFVASIWQGLIKDKVWGVVITGGDAEILAGLLRGSGVPVEVRAELVLDGLDLSAFR